MLRLTSLACFCALAACAPDPIGPLRCDEPGTHLENGRCVGTTCGEGTVEGDGVCLPLCGVGTALADDGTCAAIPSCGPGTHAEGTVCVPDEGGVVCGSGTIEQSGVCVPNVGNGQVVCGTGTIENNGVCEPTLRCGPGTIQDAQDRCVVDGGVVISDLFDVRIPETVQAMAFPVRVLAIGRIETGASLVDVDVVFQLDRASAGVIPDPTRTLGLFGVTTTLLPCLESEADCLGPARVDLVVAGNVVASAPFEIVAPTSVGDPTPCFIGGNAVYMNGPPGDYIHGFEDLITQGTFSSQTSAGFARVSVDPADPNAQGLWWDMEFEAPEGEPLAESVYLNATRYPFNNSGPGLSVGGDGRGCNTLSGSFQIFAIDVTGTTLNTLTATWLQSCDGGPEMAGCVHFEQ